MLASLIFTILLVLVATALVVVFLSQTHPSCTSLVATNISHVNIPTIQVDNEMSVSKNVVSVACLPRGMVLLHRDMHITHVGQEQKVHKDEHGFIVMFGSQRLYLHQPQTTLCQVTESTSVLKSNTNILLKKNNTTSLLFQVQLGSLVGACLVSGCIKFVVIHDAVAKFFTLALHTSHRK